MIQLQSVEKSYNGLHAVHPLSLTIHKGEIHGIIGTSGAGKSTLVRMMNLLERPDSGNVYVDGQELTALKEAELRQARQSIGMIFQQFQLVLNRTVGQNVEMPLELMNVPKAERKTRVEECLHFVGLSDKNDAYPAQLSGGQKQRVAIARALANNPPVLLCDEPTSALDPSTTSEILQVLKNVNEAFGATIVIVTHEMNVVKSICNRVSIMKEGQLVETLSIEPLGVETNENSYIEDLRKIAKVND